MITPAHTAEYLQGIPGINEERVAQDLNFINYLLKQQCQKAVMADSHKISRCQMFIRVNQ